MNFKYKLTEQDEPGSEETGGLGVEKKENELELKALGSLDIDKLLNIIEDPKNLKGVYTSVSSGLDEFLKKVFGEPLTPSNNKKNTQIYKENGRDLYMTIFKAMGKGFQKDQTSTEKDKEGNILYKFPNKTEYNRKLVTDYFNQFISGGKTSIKSKLSPKVIDDTTSRFPLSDNVNIKKILDNAVKNGDLTDNDYSLTKKAKLDESIKMRLRVTKILNENLLNIDYKLAEKLYNILKEKYPQVGEDTLSSFFFYINDKLK